MFFNTSSLLSNNECFLSNNACCTVTFRTRSNTSFFIGKQIIYQLPLADYQVTIKFKVKYLRVCDVGCNLRRYTEGLVPGKQQYPSNQVTIRILVGIGAISAAFSTPNWSLCCGVRASTWLGNDVWWQQRQNRRNRTRRQVFLLVGTSRINLSWWPPLYCGCHETLLLAPKHTTINQHARQQVCKN
jgi:hypothetical protein